MNLFNGDVTGIDLGKRTVKLVQCNNSGNVVRVKKAAVIELPDNYSDDTFIDVALDAINRNRKKNKITLNNVAIVCPSQLYASFSVTLPVMPKKDLIAALEWEVKKASGKQPEELNIDYYPNRVSNNQIDYLVYYAEKAKIDQLANKFASYKIKLRYIDVDDLAEVACFNALYSDDGTVKAFFDFGATKSHILIVKSGCILLNRTLTENLATMYEMLKGEIFENLNYKDALELRGFKEPEVAKLLTNYINDIIFELNRSIDYFKATFRLPSPTNIFLSGGGFSIPGMLEYFKNNLTYPVTLNNVLEIVGCKDETVCKYGYLFTRAVGVAVR